MRQGVRDSQVFLLVLSENVLGSWFCQQELRCAITLGKPIQLVVETDDRFNPFDFNAWTAFNTAMDQEMRRNPARIDTPKTAMGPESSFSLTRQAQTNRYDRRIKIDYQG
jgi:hypothetical protein